MSPASPDLTQLLASWREGNPAAREQLIEAVYLELRRLAHHHLRRERSGHTLQTTALVHDAFLELVDQRQVEWQGRAHFFGIAALVMRRILVEHARTAAAQKRGGDFVRVPLDDDISSAPDRDFSILALEEVLERLAALDPQQGRIVELRFFGGLTVEETAHVTGLSPRTVKREWRMAKAWLQRELQGWQQK